MGDDAIVAGVCVHDERALRAAEHRQGRLAGAIRFFDQEIYEGRSILVRYVWSSITPKSAHFEQSYSLDGGKTWEPNWVADQTRVE